MLQFHEIICDTYVCNRNALHENELILLSVQQGRFNIFNETSESCRVIKCSQIRLLISVMVGCGGAGSSAASCSLGRVELNAHRSYFLSRDIHEIC